MLVNFFTNEKNEKKEVKHKTDLTPRVKSHVKYRKDIDIDGKEVIKPVINLTESYYCYMSGPQSMKIAFAIGLTERFHRHGMWLLSKSKYKQAQRLLKSKGLQAKLIPSDKERARKEKIRSEMRKKRDKLDAKCKAPVVISTKQQTLEECAGQTENTDYNNTVDNT